MGTLRLAIKYLLFNKVKSAILIGCILLTSLLPFAIRRLLDEFNRNMMGRSEATPIVIGAKGSPLDLALHALYFKRDVSGNVPMNETTRIRETGLAEPIPIHAKYTARKFPIVGTTIEYFPFRNLRMAAGSEFGMLGECVLGSQVAESSGLSVGDTLLSDRENVIDIAGLYPLKMKIVGVLAPSQSADDRAVFVDLKTVWIIAGLGHGHEDVNKETDKNKILREDNKNIVANAAVLPFTEVTEENLESFHFHGDQETFPLTAIIATPTDTKSKTLLEGQYDVGNSPLQFVIPTEPINDLMNIVFRIKTFFDANAILVSVSTFLLLGLVIMLSLRLRAREMQTMMRIGCSKGTIALLQFWELAIIFGVAALLLLASLWGLDLFAGRLVEILLLNR